jgi:hypothetical protein
MSLRAEPFDLAGGRFRDSRLADDLQREAPDARRLARVLAQKPDDVE